MAATFQLKASGILPITSWKGVPENTPRRAGKACILLGNDRRHNRLKRAFMRAEFFLDCSPSSLNLNQAFSNFTK